MRNLVLFLFVLTVFWGGVSAEAQFKNGDLVDYSKIPRLQWVGPGQPDTFEEYEATRSLAPLRTGFVAAIEPENVGPKGPLPPKVLILVNGELQPQIATKLNRYVTIISAEGYTAELYTCTAGTPEELKSFIVGKASNLYGCVFVGDLPAAWYEQDYDGEHAEFPCELYYMDLDGSWSDGDSDGKFDTHTAGTGDMAPDIWVSRIDASRISYDDEAVLTNRYLDKAMAYYRGEYTFTNGALAYTEHDWVEYPEFSSGIAVAYPDREAFLWPDVSRADYLANRLPNVSYDFIQISAHSSPTSHSFTVDGSLSNLQIWNAAPHAYFYNLFACSSSRFTQTNNLGVVYVFNPSPTCLASVGSSKTGSMLVFHNFYTPLAEGETLGEAFRLWFESLAPYSADEIHWHYGMCIIGDPLIRPRVQPPLDDPYEQNDMRATAYDLTGGRGKWLSELEGKGIQRDSDWYKIEARTGVQRIIVDCTFTHSLGNINVRLANSSGTILASSTSTTNREYIDYATTTAGAYWIQVYGNNLANDYDLYWKDEGQGTLNLTKTGSGSVRVNGTLRTLPWSGSFAYESSVTLQAVPDAGQAFLNWSGAASGSSSSVTYVHTVNGATVTANFDKGLKLTSPVGGEKYLRGVNTTITWIARGNASGVPVRIELHKGGTLKSYLSKSAANTGSYAWFVSPDLAVGTDYKIKIVSTANSVYNDISAAPFEILTSSLLAITYPNGGETLNRGGTTTITWSSDRQLVTSKMTLRLFKDNMLHSVIADKLTNTGSYAWVLPPDLPSASTYKIKISPSTTGSPLDFSDANFSIGNSSDLQVTAPNGGENLIAGAQTTLTWTSTPAAGSSVGLALWKGNVRVLTLSNGRSNTGSFVWQVPWTIALGSDYRIRVFSVEDPEIGDFSDADFTIGVSEDMQMVYPNGGETVLQGYPVTLRWNSDLIAAGNSVKLKLFNNKGFYAWISGSASNSGSYQWKVPATTPAGQYWVQVYSASNFSVMDFSDGPFSIVAPPPIFVTAPNGGETFIRGSNTTITWVTSSPSVGSSVSIQLLKEGFPLQWIVENTANDGSFYWMVPPGLGTDSDYSIKVASVSDPGLSDVSNGPFTIGVSSGLTVTSPNGGETITRYGTTEIKWTSDVATAGDFVKIKLFKNDTFLEWVSSRTANTGSFIWSVPATLDLGSDYRVQVYSYSNLSIMDFSDAPFSIVDPTPIVMSRPLGGMSFCPTQTMLIRWSTPLPSVGDTVKIELRKGGYYSRLVGSGLPNTGSYDWFIHPAVKDDDTYTIRVISMADEALYGESESFTIAGHPDIVVTSPSGGETLTPGGTATITWTSNVAAVGSEVKLKLYEMSTLQLVISQGTANTGSFVWNIPVDLPESNYYYMAVQSKSNVNIVDVSDDRFYVHGRADCKVTKPESYERMVRGGQYTITWTGDSSVLGSTVKIKLYKGSVSHSWISTGTSNTGSFVWTLSPDLVVGDDYRIQVLSATDASVQDVSEPFTIDVSQLIHLTSPNGGESYKAGTSMTIRWGAHPDVGSTVKLKLFKGNVYQRWIHGGTVNDGVFDWNIPADVPAGTDYKVQVYSSTNFEYMDFSDANFSVTAP